MTEIKQTYQQLEQELEVWRNGPSCWSCGDSGDVHQLDGEWLGKCNCLAAQLIDVTAERDQLKAENDRLTAHIADGMDCKAVAIQGMARLTAENEALRKERTDWQAECLKRGFEYVRESDDHYVLADVPEMADLLGALLGVEVRSKENDSYDEANSQLNEQIEGLINTIHKQESMRKDAEFHQQVQRGAGELPHGWEILIRIEKDAGNAELIDPEGNEVDYPSNHECLADSVSDAIDEALSSVKKTGD